MTDNLVTCKRCKQNMIDEQYEEHICTVLPKGDKVIDADYYIITKDSFGRDLIEIKGLDGITYKFPIIPEGEFNKIPYDPTNRELTGKNNNHEVNSSLSMILLTCCQILFLLAGGWCIACVSSTNSI
jgi:hypothetical protein